MDGVAPTSCTSATPMPATVMNAALSTFTAATTRARRSAPAQACTAENVGTMNSPAAMASPARSAAMRRPRTDENTSAMLILSRRTPGSRSPSRDRAQTRASNNAASSVGNRTMRPCASQEASAEPTPIATANMARKAVMTLSSPPITVLASGGSSDSTTAPTSQNQLVTRPPHHSRGSALSAPNRRNVERTILKSSLRSGAARPDGGMKRAAMKLASATTIIALANEAWSGPSRTASPPAIVPARMAMKVALSTRALPAGSSDCCK